MNNVNNISRKKSLNKEIQKLKFTYKLLTHYKSFLAIH